MKKTIYFLVALFCLQVVLAVVFRGAGRQENAEKGETSLAHFIPGDITSVEIAGTKNKKVILKKEHGKWKLPEHFNFPADSKAVNDFLKDLAGLEAGWPVATTEDAFDRFKVGPENFERHIVLFKNGEKSAEIFLGTSPGVRKIHARTSGNNNIYEVRFSLFKAATDPDSWIDKDLLRIDQPAVTAIELPAVKIIKKNGSLQPDDLGANETVVKGGVEGLVNKVCTLSIEGVLGTSPPEGFKADSPGFQFAVVLEPDNLRRDYIFSKPEGKGYYILKTSDRPEYFKVAQWLVNGIKDVKRDDLVKKAEPEKEGKAGSE